MKDKSEKKIFLTEEELELIETGYTGLNFLEILKNVFKKLD